MFGGLNCGFLRFSNYNTSNTSPTLNPPKLFLTGEQEEQEIKFKWFLNGFHGLRTLLVR